MELISIVLWIVTSLFGIAFISTFTVYQLEDKGKDDDGPTPTLMQENTKRTHNGRGVFDGFELAYPPGNLRGGEDNMDEWVATPETDALGKPLNIFVESDSQTLPKKTYTFEGKRAFQMTADSTATKLSGYRTTDTMPGKDTGLTNSSGYMVLLLRMGTESGYTITTDDTGKGFSIMLNVSTNGVTLKYNDISNFNELGAMRPGGTIKFSDATTDYPWVVVVIGRPKWTVSTGGKPPQMHFGAAFRNVNHQFIFPNSEVALGEVNAAMNKINVRLGLMGRVASMASTPAIGGFWSRLLSGDETTERVYNDTNQTMMIDVLTSANEYMEPSLKFVPSDRTYYVGHPSSESDYKTVTTLTYPFEDYKTTLNSQLPPGLKIDKFGNISGTPTVAGFLKTIKVRLENTVSGLYAESNVTISVKQYPSIKYVPSEQNLDRFVYTEIAPPVLTGDANDVILRGGSVVPPGMTFHDDGSITGEPTTEGTYTLTVGSSSPPGTTVADATLTITVNGDPDPGPSPYPDTTVNYPEFTRVIYEKVASITPVVHGDPTGTFSITPALPAGITLSTTTGAITGVPTRLTILKNFTVSYKSDYVNIQDTFQIIVAAQSIMTNNTSDLRVGSFVNRSFTFIPALLHDHTIGFSEITPELPRGLILDRGTIFGEPVESTPSTTYEVINKFVDGHESVGNITFSTSSKSGTDTLGVISYILLALFVFSLIIAIVVHVIYNKK